MRRNDREITDKSAIEDIIRRSLVCRLGMCDDGQPYVVPLCFGYLDGALYFHSALEGRKLDALRANPRVCVEFDIDQRIAPAATLVQNTMHYRSVIGFGMATFVEDPDEKRRGLLAIVEQYTEMTETLPDEALPRVAVIKVTLEELTGKGHGYPTGG